MASQTATSTNLAKKADLNYNNPGLPDTSSMNNTEVEQAMWGITPSIAKELASMNKVYSSKHGMFATVPIICREDQCAYKDVCMVSPANRVKGQRCPMEIAAIVSRYTQYCQHFDIRTVDDMIDPKDLVDATLIKDLVNIEVQQLRAENKIAINGDFMAKTLLDIDRKCNPYFGEDVSPEANFLMNLQDKKIKILNQLNSTRKDKASDRRLRDASEEAIRIFQEARSIDKKNQTVDITDVVFDEEGNPIESLDMDGEYIVIDTQDDSENDDSYVQDAGVTDDVDISDNYDFEEI